MNAVQETSTNLTVEIPNRDLARSMLHAWSKRPGVSVKILRARVTADLARFELEIRGASPEVARILRQSETWDPSRELACVV